MKWLRGPFDPLDAQDRTLMGILSGAAGLVGIGIAIYFLIRDGLEALPVALITASVGLYALAIAMRLLTNRSPFRQGYLTSPWLTLTVGILFIAVAVGNLAFGSADALWLIPPGALATIFAWRQLRRRASA